MKICRICKLEKDESEFWKNIVKTDGLQTQCKDCQRLYHQDYYQKNKIEVKKRTGKRRDDNKHMLKKIVVDFLLEHPCVDCGEKDIVLLDFDHVSGSKTSDVSSMIRDNVPTQRMLNEMTKCVIRCVSCHRRKTAKDFGWYRLNPTNNDI
jgi:hypothetical protein